MTNVYGLLVTRNEADRYLESCLRWANGFLDGIFVFDDRSTDNTAQLASDLGCSVVVRNSETPSFLDHEAKFRLSAWQAFESVVSPSPGDWVLAFDADEFLVSDISSVRGSLDKAIRKAKTKDSLGVILPFREIFKIEDNKLYSRIDGFWGKVRGPRLFAYQGNATWNNKAMGCGSEPTYVSASRKHSENTCGLSMIHLGYARDSDKQAKYSRYSSLIQHGHNDTHIESILRPPTLIELEGRVPDFAGVSFE